MKAKSRMLVGAAAMLGAGLTFGVPKSARVSDPKEGPVFTDEELAWIRSLPKKEKKRAVEQLKEKYRRGV